MFGRVLLTNQLGRWRTLFERTCDGRLARAYRSSEECSGGGLCRYKSFEYDHFSLIATPGSSICPCSVQVMGLCVYRSSDNETLSGGDEWTLLHAVLNLIVYRSLLSEPALSCSSVVFR